MIRFVLTAALVVCLVTITNSNRLTGAEKARESALGRAVANMSLTDHRGASVALDDFKDKPVIVSRFWGLSVRWPRLR